ncbi:hypothetical protein AYO40_03460 [Planctomycetaceae bacterium SCGC AG-212-D15]|nr:hypothetical protein AYO40_03460 [Planctomycetaceae bacterium SCGC AG-212-D15]
MRIDYGTGKADQLKAAMLEGEGQLTLSVAVKPYKAVILTESGEMVVMGVDIARDVARQIVEAVEGLERGDFDWVI